MKANSYDHKKIEAKWQKKWEEQKLYQTPEGVTKENKFYILPQLPYPSGEGLHVGHAEVYTACDIYARYQRMNGKKVLQVIGWDAFGLPAENFAIKNNVHPRINTNKAIDNFRKQIKSLGISIDWSREVGSHNPDYYHWTQWFFLLFYERGLAYRKKQKVNWCSSCKTVLANEQVVDGKCERCGTEIEQREMEQWYIKITDYADRLSDDLDKIDWPKETVRRQKEWIGKKKGAEVTFKLSVPGQEEGKHGVTVFTTRLDTIFGVTFVTVSPEVAKKWLDVGWKAPEEVKKYVEKALSRTDKDRMEGAGEKTGVFTKVYAINPTSKEKVPVWVADYVLGEVGTGAVMGVPAHDDRDFDFAKKFSLPIIPVVLPQREYEDENARSYFHKRTEINKQLLKELIQKAVDNNRKLMVMGGWAVAIQAGQILREFDDLDLIILKEDAGWWRDQLEKIGLTISNMFPEGMNDKYYFQATKQDVHVDLLVFTIGEDKNVISLTSTKPRNQHKRFDQMFEKKEFEGLPVYVLSQNDIYEWKKDHQTKRGVVRWKEEADFTILGREPYVEDGELVNSEKYNGLSSEKARQKILTDAQKEGWAKEKTTYHLHDWSVSRQRFWGAPIPMVYDPEGKLHPVKKEDLPVILPDDVDFKPTGQSPLTYSDSFQKGVEKKYGKGWKREVDTLDTFMCSSWYYYRYLDPHNSKEFASAEALKNWMPVDFYLGGVEHVNGHLLYARFFTKVLYDAGYIDFDEPFSVHRHQGTILGPDNKRMSKRWGNVINPTDVVETYGADTARVYEMFMGPLEQDKSWNDNAVQGVRRFLTRIWNIVMDEKKSQAKNSSEELKRLLHKTIRIVTEDTKRLKFNTTIARFMEFSNLWIQKDEHLSKDDTITLLKLLAPFAPHMTEELWQDFGQKGSIHIQPWPEYEEKLLVKDEVTIVVQVNGKLRAALVIDAKDSHSKERMIEKAKQDEKVKQYLEGKEIKKEIFVPGKLVNFVVN